MIPVTMRALLDDWENRGLLYRIKREVDPRYELGAVVNTKNGKQPFLFEKVKGYQSAMAAGLGGDRELVADSMGIHASELIPKIIDSIVNPIPTTLKETGPVQENLVTGDFDLADLFPIPTFHEGDSGAYYVSGILVVKDITGKKRYTSIRRMQYLGGNRTNILITSPELLEQYSYFEKNGEPMEVAVMFGVVPAVVLSSQISTHLYHTDKLDVAGALLGQSLDVVRCKTVDLDVLAEAEIVFEGRMLPNEREMEGPFGELAGYYGFRSPQPIVEISAVTYRNQAINQTIFPSSYEERLPMALVREATLLSTVRQVVPNIKGVHIPMGGVARYHAVIQIEKKSEGDGKQAALAAFASDKDLKHVVVVNDDVDIFDSEDVEWAIATRVQASNDVFIVPGAKGSPLESSHNLRGVSDKMGIDATYPLGEEEMFRRTSIPIEVNLEDYL
ncbi:UbiD family decarboxylase [Bacillus sp. DTU_2020_1000418_1_SI_GHA_SEK_038]|uniref:UbiD family decarboxylase n=1 Tax=Bacillus sp. DTU_2020_1000418_1_SI_GHA_SEK_038 TaxID=3077585 RepID=UPI0028E9B72B|nr:UbiD family decarboxylase [Bacillus sp. DTU_2020_1000418_1_SI_GHA_SEK_038]WNS77400.1 UbiD family decarboxylase [Bacillus sp. DTU_2020_1000418_1_SI_GHA_SEK_038]